MYSIQYDSMRIPIKDVVQRVATSTDNVIALAEKVYIALKNCDGFAVKKEFIKLCTKELKKSRTISNELIEGIFTQSILRTNANEDTILRLIKKVKTQLSKNSRHATSNQNPDLNHALELIQKARESTSKIKQKAEIVDNDAIYRELQLLLQQELEPLSRQIAELISKNPSALDYYILFSEGIKEIASAYDSCIEALTKSSLYAENQELLATRFIELIESLLESAEILSSKSVLNNHDLNVQVSFLIPWLKKCLSASKKNLKTPETLRVLLEPESQFKIELISLGSHFLAPERCYGDIAPLKLIFSVIHNSLLTSAHTVASRSGLDRNMLPEAMISASNELTFLQTGVRDDRSQNVTIQSIVYNLPMIKVIFSCPLNKHSAKFTLIGELDSDQKLKKMIFEGIFIAPDGGGIASRNITLGMYAFSIFNHMIPSTEIFRSQLDNFGLKFFVNIPLDKLDSFYRDLQHHLQIMIDFLQHPLAKPITYKSEDLISFLNRAPEFASVIVTSDACSKEECKAIIQKLAPLLSLPTIENARGILEMGSDFLNNCGSSTDLNPVIDIIIEHDEFWQRHSFNRTKDFFSFLEKKCAFSTQATEKLKLKSIQLKNLIIKTPQSFRDEIYNILLRDFIEKYGT